MTNEALRARLQAERTRLLEVHAAASRLHTSDANGDGGNAMTPDTLTSEKASETIDRELDESVAQHAETELAEIEAALTRLEAGTYGICEACSQPIKEERLEVLPAARYCIEDQAKVESSR